MLLARGRSRLLTLAAITLVGALAWRLWPQPSAEAIVRRGLGCLETRDAECLYELAERGDIEAYGLNREQFVKLMDEYVFRGAWTKLGEPAVRPGPLPTGYQGQVHFSQLGNTVTFGILAEHTGERNELVGLVTSLILCRMPTAADSDPPGQRMLEWIRRDSEALERLGVRGLNRSKGFMTWSELESHYRNLPLEP